MQRTPLDADRARTFVYAIRAAIVSGTNPKHETRIELRIESR